MTRTPPARNSPTVSSASPRGRVKDILPGLPVPRLLPRRILRFPEHPETGRLGQWAGDPAAHNLRHGRGMAPWTISMAARAFSRAPWVSPGLATNGSPHDVAWAIARQSVPLGFNWIHSPVLDVNTNPLNPEVGTRSYGEDSETVATLRSRGHARHEGGRVDHHRQALPRTGRVRVRRPPGPPGDQLCQGGRWRDTWRRSRR